MNARISRDNNREPPAYAGRQSYAMVRELIQPGVMTKWLEDDNLWVPQSESVSLKPLMLNTSNGYFVNLLRVRTSGVISVHKHSGPVHAFVLRGRWYYLEHDWIAEEGSYAFESPGEVHTLYVPSDVKEMITLFHATGSYTYLNEKGEVIGMEDVFTKIEHCRKHYEKIGLGADYVDQFIR
jgi:quercetin dioxygenase-like cupin family protein